MPLASVEEALEDFKQGKFIIVMDDANRENEGDLIMAAEKVTPEAVNFAIENARGLLCMPIIGERLDELNISMMVDGNNSAKHGTAFTVSVDYSKGTTTGISSYDRAATIRALANSDSRPEDFAKPGHLFPLRYQEGGVLVRPGHTEATVDLARMAGFYPAGIVCEILNSDGTMARMPELEAFSQKHNIKVVTIAQIIAARRRSEKLVKREAEASLPTSYGTFKIVAYTSLIEPGEHLALVMGKWKADEPVLVRVHSECLTGDVFSSLRCDCGEQIRLALSMISEKGAGVFIYLRQEGRGIGLHNKIRAYSLQDTGMDTVEANESLGFDPDLRHYDVAAQMLLDLRVKRLLLATNNPHKIAGLGGYGLEIVERVPLETQVNEKNREYMSTKRSRMGHFIQSC